MSNDSSASYQLRRGNGWPEESFTQIANDLLLDGELSSNARLLYCLLATHLNQERVKEGDRRVWPSQGALAKSLKVSDRTVRTYLRELEVAGWIDSERQGKTRPNIYIVHGARQDRSDRKPVSDHSESDRKPVSGHDRKPVSGHRPSDRKPASDELYESREQYESEPHESFPRAKRATNGTRARTDQDDFFDAVAWVLHGTIDREQFKLLSQKARAHIGTIAKRLRESGKTLDDIRAWWRWWEQCDWRGRQGQRPTPSQFTDSWPQFETWRADGCPAPRASANGAKARVEASIDAIDEWARSKASG